MLNSISASQGAKQQVDLLELEKRQQDLQAKVQHLVQEQALGVLDHKLEDAFPSNARIESQMIPWKQFFYRVGQAYEQAYHSFTGVISKQNSNRESVALTLSTGVINASIASAFGPISPLMNLLMDETRNYTIDFLATEQKRIYNKEKGKIENLIKKMIKTKVFNNFLFETGVGSKDDPSRVKNKLNEAGMKMEQAIWDHLIEARQPYRTRQGLREILTRYMDKTGLQGLDAIEYMEQDCLKKIQDEVNELMDELEFPKDYKHFLDEGGVALLKQDMEKRLWARWIKFAKIGQPQEACGHELSLLPNKPGRTILERFHQLGIIDLESRLPSCFRYFESYVGPYKANPKARLNGLHFGAFYSSLDSLKALRRWAQTLLSEKPEYHSRLPMIPV